MRPVLFFDNLVCSGFFGWREEARELHERLRQTKGQDSPTAEALAIIARYDELLAGLSEANREKLPFAIRQTVKQRTLRREI